MLIIAPGHGHMGEIATEPCDEIDRLAFPPFDHRRRQRQGLRLIAQEEFMKLAGTIRALP
ncbi:MAG: hypothetical protein QM775_25590 [Pirellulales bacterium]